MSMYGMGNGIALFLAAATSAVPSGPAGGDLSGTYPNPTVAQLTGSTGVVTVVSGTSMTFAAATASAGAGSIRTYHNFTIQGRNNANSADRNLLSWGNVANDTVALGDSNVALQINSTTATFLDASAIVHGTNPSATGNFRIKQGYTIKGRNAANSADATILDWGTTSNTLTIGNSGFSIIIAASFTSNGNISMATGTSIIWGSAASATINTTAKSGNGANTTITAQGSNAANGNGGALLLQGGAKNGTGLKGGVQLCLNGATEVQVECAEVVSGNSVVALVRGSALTSTQMPANTGNGVIYIANAKTLPTANSVGGGILYCDAGALKYRGTGGTTTTLGAA